MADVTEARLAEIEGRLAKTTPPPWSVHENPSLLREMMPAVYGEDDTVIHRPPQSRKEAMGEFFTTVLSGRVDEDDARFIAAARQDVEDLVAAVKVRDGVIHDLQQDSEAYRQGYAGGLRRASESLIASGEALADKARAKVGKSGWRGLLSESSGYTKAGAMLSELAADATPLPPDVVRRENATLRQRVSELEAAAKEALDALPAASLSLLSPDEVQEVRRKLELALGEDVTP